MKRVDSATKKVKKKVKKGIKKNIKKNKLANTNTYNMYYRSGSKLATGKEASYGSMVKNMTKDPNAFESAVYTLPIDVAIGGVTGGMKNAAKEMVPIWKRGLTGEKALKNVVGGSHHYFKTPRGARIVDSFSDGIAHESKVGYTTKSKRIVNQVLKDRELLNIGEIDDAVWHFYQSPTTGKIGPSKSLAAFLKENNIKYTLH